MGLLDDLKAKGSKLATQANQSLSDLGGGGAGQANKQAEGLLHDLGVITWLELQGRADGTVAAEKERVLGALQQIEAQSGPVQPVMKSAAPPAPGAAGGAPPPPGAGAAPPPPGGAAAPPPPGGAAAPPPAPGSVAPPPAPGAVGEPAPPASEPTPTQQPEAAAPPPPPGQVPPPPGQVPPPPGTVG